ncbi:hypothetical protein B0H16DRAFT_1797730 [Mycena metata]|uniref:Uncharacterized protein n=1 Tax=Mycena metata TaxID=1033252 RepID=A0AAD7HDZ9_9AGAR|nr:hypothetical protein B0H16DRAFT_1797730 [Mycena metata]
MTPSTFSDVVNKYAGQCRRLEVALSIYGSRLSLPGPFPLLSSLALSMSPFHFGSNAVLATVKDSPRLRELRLFHNFTLSNVSFNALLTCLEIQQRVSLRECAGIFLRFPTLLYLRLDIDPEATPAPPVGDPPVFQSLDLDGNGRLLLDHLTLPFLHRLHFSIDTEEAHGSLLAFLQRSTFPLSDLTLRFRTFEVDDGFLADCFRAVPRLQALNLEYAEPDAMSLVLYNLVSLDLLPDLQTLSVREPESRCGFCYDEVIDMLRARLGSAPTPLSSVELILLGPPTQLCRGSESPWFSGYEQSPPQEDKKAIQRFIKGGLRFRFHSPHIEWPKVKGPARDELLEFPIPHPNLQIYDAYVFQVANDTVFAP